jgi:hypothetical protein
MANSVGSSITGIVKPTGRFVGVGALILLGLGAAIALQPTAISQAPAPANQAPAAGGDTQMPIAGGARGAGASGVMQGGGFGGGRGGRFGPPTGSGRRAAARRDAPSPR